jgi:hypothetical protein
MRHEAIVEAVVGAITGIVCAILVAAIVVCLGRQAVSTIVYEVSRDRVNNCSYVSAAQARAYRAALQRGLSHEDAAIEAMYSEAVGGGE